MMHESVILKNKLVLTVALVGKVESRHLEHAQDTTYLIGQNLVGPK